MFGISEAVSSDIVKNEVKRKEEAMRDQPKGANTYSLMVASHGARCGWSSNISNPTLQTTRRNVYTMKKDITFAAYLDT